MVMSALLWACVRGAFAANVPADYFHDTVEIAIVDYQSYSSEVTNFPLRVEISETRVPGFKYARVDGSEIPEIRFWFETVTNATGKTVFTPIPHRIINWSTTSNSLIYVQIPRYAQLNEVTFRVVMGWARQEGAVLPEVDPELVTVPPSEEQLSSRIFKENWECQEKFNEFISFGEVVRDGENVNYWRRWPYISKTSWRAGEKAATINAGIANHGLSVITFYESDELNAPLPGMPVVAGDYRMEVSVPAGRDDFGKYTSLLYATNFSITAGAEIGGVAGPDDFAYSATMTVTGYTRSEILQNFPALVRLKQNEPMDFDYSLFPYGASTAAEVYADLAFFDASGQRLSYEIASWNPTGESLVWVKLPVMTKNTEFKMCWGRAAGTKKLNNVPKDVWSEYFAVIHFDETIASGEAAEAESADSTGFGRNAVPRNYNDAQDLRDMTVSEAGLFGNARRLKTPRQNASATYQKTARFELKGSEDLILGSQFTVSGFFKSEWKYNQTDYNNTILVGRRKDTNVAGTDGWVVSLASSSDALHAETGGDGSKTLGQTGTTTGMIAPLKNAWTFFSAAYRDDNLTLVGGTGAVAVVTQSGAVNPVVSNQLNQVISIGALDETTPLLPFDGLFDEIRIRRGAANEAWSWAECAQAFRPTFLTGSPVIRDTSKTLENRWTRFPSLSKTNWSPEDDPATIDKGTTLGDGLSIHVFVTFQDRTMGEIFDEMPVELGEYRAIFTFPGDATWSELVETIDFRIAREREIYDFGEDNLGRTLLGNDDYSIAGGEIEFQSYDDTESGWDVPYWKHLDAEGELDDRFGTSFTKVSAYYNLFGGTHHELWFDELDEEGELSPTKLWGLMDVRMGNTFNNQSKARNERGTAGLNADQNYLPWNPKSQRMLGYSGLAVGDYHAWVGQLLMRNRIGASVNSRLFTDGIGTIYFDAVNSHVGNITNAEGRANYKLVVEVATNYLYKIDDIIWESHDPPTDDAIAAEGCYNPYFYANFKPVSFHVYHFHGEKCEEYDTNELTLDEVNGGSFTNFYRVVAKINLYIPARFRIRRVTCDADYEADADVGAFVILDNIIASKPADRVILEPYGEYDPTLRGKQIVGQGGAFTPAFPGIGDSVIPRVRARTPDGSAVDPERITAVTMHYRWHYLGQEETKWDIVDMDTRTLTSRNEESLLVPGYDGDIEFWFEGTQNGGYYHYADYSGTGLGVPHYSESIPAFTNRYSATENWFVRIREGSSEVSQFALEVREPASWYGSAYVTNVYPFSVIADHTWRAFLPVTNEVKSLEGLVDYRVVRRDLQESGSTEYAHTTNYFVTADMADVFPETLQLEDVGLADGWAKLKPGYDSTRTDNAHYLMFKFNDQRDVVTISRAEYQNFNAWNDAHGENFVGVGIEDNGRPPSGSSGKVQTFTWPGGTLVDTEATREDWCLTFEETPFTITNRVSNFFEEGNYNLFAFYNAKYVRGAYDDVASGTALQLFGHGLGKVEMSQTPPGVPWPRGIESVSFTARIAQDVVFDDVCVAQESYNREDDVFYVRAAFDTAKNLGYTGHASLSFFGLYSEQVGGYEVRFEQEAGNIETNHGVIVHGPDRDQKTVSVYRWTLTGDAPLAEKVASKVIEGRFPTTDTPTNNLIAFRLEAHSSGGVNTIRLSCATNTIDTIETDLSGRAWSELISYSDSAIDSIAGGAYGVLSANCDAIFMRPQLEYVESVTGQETRVIKELDRKIGWQGPSTREVFTNAWDTFGLVAYKPQQTLHVSLHKGVPPGAIDPNVYAEKDVTVSGFGVIDSSIDVWKSDAADFCLTEDCVVKIKTGGSLDSRRVDVAIDNIRVNQWAGQDMLGGYGDFAYTSGWIAGGKLRLSARRTKAESPASIRTPLCDMKQGRGEGLGMIGFAYSNVHPAESFPDEPLLYLQIATNGVSTGNINRWTQEPSDDDVWTTVAAFTAEDLGSAGVTNIYLGMHGVTGVARLVLNQDIVRFANAPSNMTACSDADVYGTIDIDEVVFMDEPSLDKGCWWGFNVRTIGDNLDSEGRMYLPDFTAIHPAPGLSIALNNSAIDQVDYDHQSEYFEHMPFVQTPTLASGLGEVLFKARKYDSFDSALFAEVTLYGISEANYGSFNDDHAWTALQIFKVADPVYKTYSYKIPQGVKYVAFRLAVTGVENVKYPGPGRADSYPPTRVLLEEIVVSDRVDQRLGIRNVGAFRSDMAGSAPVPNVPSREEQPLCGEGWGVQCELYSLGLSDEIDLTHDPEVILHWFVGDYPWGFANWKTDSNAKKAKLAKASKDELIYRSSYLTSPDAVIPAVTDGGTVVQYMLEINFYTTDPETGLSEISTSFLSIPSGDWKNPAWYYPLDYNRGIVKDEDCAAYCILDTIAPGWAWINEVNIYAGDGERVFQPNGYVCDNDHYHQFIEVAAPIEASLWNWEVRLVAGDGSMYDMPTNTLAVFGFDQLIAEGKDAIYQASNMLFYVVANPFSLRYDDKHLLDPNDGRFDGPWNDTLSANGVGIIDADIAFWETENFALQLVRPSGIIEQELFVAGHNTYSPSSDYSPEKKIDYLNKRGSHYFYAGEDTGGAPNSLSVLTNNGAQASEWFNDVEMTPGRINKGQYIDPDHPTPNGESIIVFANVDRGYGHLYQKVGQLEDFTNASQIVVLKRGNERGTNILYKTDRFYELKSVEGEGIEYYHDDPPIGERIWRVNVGTGATKNINLFATARVEKRLRDLGVDEFNPYTPAIIDWLEKGETLNPYLEDKSFDDPYGEIHLAKFRSHHSHTIITNLTLTEMYWLDIDPTAPTNMIFEAGFDVRPETLLVYDGGDPTYGDVVTNVRLTVYMAITNDTDEVTNKYYGKCWSPYVSRGLDPSYTSWDYERQRAETHTGSWTSSTFKVRGKLLTQPYVGDWQPLRWFVFTDHSFYGVEDEGDHRAHTTEIEVADPIHSSSSITWSLGWGKYDGTQVFYGWAIDVWLQMGEIEVLEKRNWFDWDGPALSAGD